MDQLDSNVKQMGMRMIMMVMMVVVVMTMIEMMAEMPKAVLLFVLRTSVWTWTPSRT